MRPRHQRTRLGLLALCCLLLTACGSSYQSDPLPTTAVQDMSYTATLEGITVRAEPIADNKRQRALFDASLSVYGFFPVLLSIENGSSQRLLVQQDKIRLIKKGTRLGPVPALEVANLVNAMEGPDSFGLGGAGGGCYGGGCAVLLLPLVVGAVAKSAGDSATAADRATDYGQKALRTDVLDPGEEVLGAVFFRESWPSNKPTGLIIPVSGLETGALHEFEIEFSSRQETNGPGMPVDPDANSEEEP